MVKTILATIYFTIALFLYAVVIGYSIKNGNKVTAPYAITYLILCILWPITLIGVIFTKH